MDSKKPGLDGDPLNAQILRFVVDLGNTVLTKRAAGDLYRLVETSSLENDGLWTYSIKSKAPDRFRSTLLFEKVMRVLESHSFRLPVRRFVMELFDKNIMRHVVLDEEYEDR